MTQPLSGTDLPAPGMGLDATGTADDVVSVDGAGQSFTVEDARAADWALERLAEDDAERASLDAQLEDAVARLRARHAGLARRLETRGAFLRHALEQYATRHRDEVVRGKRKSLDLLHGRIGYRAKGEHLKVVDKDVLAAWLAEQDPTSGLYRLEVRPEMRALQARLRETGEIPPGCEYEPAAETFYVEPAEMPTITTKDKGSLP